MAASEASARVRVYAGYTATHNPLHLVMGVVEYAEIIGGAKIGQKHQDQDLRQLEIVRKVLRGEG